MSRLGGILFVVVVVLLAMAFAAANAGSRATLSLGLFTLYQVPVTLVAFSGLLVGMLVMFAAGIHSDLKVRKVLRDRLVEETREEQTWIDQNQRDLFAQDPGADPSPIPEAPTDIPPPIPLPSIPQPGSETDIPQAASPEESPRDTWQADSRVEPETDPQQVNSQAGSEDDASEPEGLPESK